MRYQQQKWLYVPAILVIAGILCTACPTGEDDSSGKNKVVKYTVTFNAGYDGGTAPAPITVEKGKAAEAAFPADPARAEYAFSGWYDGTTKYTKYTPVTKDVTVTAHWEARYTVTFAIGYAGAVSPEPIVLASGQSGGILFPPDPLRADYIFKGWFDGTTQYDSTTAVTSSVTLTAQWFYGYKVTFSGVSGGMAQINPIELEIGRGDTIGSRLPAAPTLPDKFTFDGWYDGADKYEATTAITKSVTLTGKWTKAADVDRITSRNSAYPVFKFTVPVGDQFGNYTKITVKFLFNNENENTAQMPPPNIRLYGNFADTYFSDDGTYYKGAVATTPYLQFNITANTAPPVQNAWYTFEIPFNGTQFSATNFTQAFPANTATGDFYFALGPGMGGGTGSAIHHTYYMTEVALSNDDGSQKIVSGGGGFSKPVVIYNTAGDITRQ